VCVVSLGKMSSTPEAPSSLPKYLAEGLPKQDVETLEDTQEYVQTLVEWMNRPVEVEVDDDEELVDVEDDGESSKGTKVVKKVPCGKNCNGCPHGPYEYRVYRTGGDVKWEYVGPVES